VVVAQGREKKEEESGSDCTSDEMNVGSNNEFKLRPHLLLP
jgi:hypothetical protein